MIPPQKPPDTVKDIYDGYTFDLKKVGYMNKDGCGSSGVWNFCADISLENVVLSVYYLVFFQV